MQSAYEIKADIISCNGNYHVCISFWKIL